jgi:nuclear transport factor 2 (NTF2) superfamily protein
MRSGAAAVVLLFGFLVGCAETTNRERPGKAITTEMATHANELWKGTASERVVMAETIKETERHRKRMLSESIEEFYARVSDEELRKRWVEARELTRTKVPVLLEMATKLEAEGASHWDRTGRVNWKSTSYPFIDEYGHPGTVTLPISNYNDYLALQNYANRLDEHVMTLVKLNGTYQELLDALIEFGSRH